MSKIAVIIPVYKVEPYLRRCVDSVLAQSFSDLRIVLVDDGSPDRCGLICDEYAARDARITVLHQDNRGLSCARNAALDWLAENATTDWVFCLDSDDYIHPDSLRLLYDAAVEKDCKVAAAGIRHVDVDSGNEQPLDAVKFCTCKPETYWSDSFWGAIVAWGKLYDYRLFKDVRYPLGKLHEDLYVTHRLLFAASSVAVTDAQLYCYCHRSDSIMGRGLTKGRAEDQLEGALVQCEYLHANGYHRALAASLALVSKAINEARMCGIDVRMAKHQLAAYAKQLRAQDLLPLNRNYDTYHILHPLLINSYTWRIIGRLLT